jgi:glycosyltransferase involved in cell wall biosynthesis
MRIAYLHQYFNTPDMAGGTRSYEMARRLVAWGHEVHMITTWREPTDKTDWFETEVDGIHVHWLPVPYSNRMGYNERLRAFFRFAVGAARRAAAIPVDVVFGTSTPLTIAIPGAYAAFRQKVPFVFEVRDLWPDVPIAFGVLRSRVTIAMARWLEAFAYARAARVVALAPGMKEAICKKGYPAERVDVIPNGADFDRFQVPTDGGDVVGNYHWLRGTTLVVYVGTLGPANGVDYIIRVAAAIKKANPGSNTRFAILGGGRCEEDAKRLAQELGVLDERVFFMGAVPKREVPMWMAASAATLMTYDGPEIVYRDSVSNKFFDSLAAGRPVFANFRGFSTLVAERHGAGCVLPRDDFGRAAEMLEGRLQDCSWLEAAGRLARELGLEYFDRERLAHKLEQALANAAAGTAAEPSGAEFMQLWDESRSATE